MRFCFIIEEQYKNEMMPMAIIQQLRTWGHTIDMLKPQAIIANLCHLTEQSYDAYIVKTVSDGPGLSLLEAIEAVGIPTINSSHAIRRVRDKTIAMALAYAHNIPIPQTYFVADLHLLEQVPPMHYPLVVKATNGSNGQGIYLVNHPAELATLQIAETCSHFFLVQRYVENSGFDIKIYVVGDEVFSVVKRSPLHPDVVVEKRCIPTSIEQHELALRIGYAFGLDIYGLDIVETPQGPVVVDINDFPSFGLVPAAVQRIASYILHVAQDTSHCRMFTAPYRWDNYRLALQNTKAVEVLSSPEQLC